MSCLIFFGLFCSTIAVLAQQARPGLTDIIPIEPHVNAIPTSLFVSPDHQIFASRLWGCSESSNIPFFRFTVFRDDGQIQSNRSDLRIPGELVAVGNRGELWVAGIFCADEKPLAKIDPSGELAWRSALAFGPRAIAVDPTGRGIVAGIADGMAVVAAVDSDSGTPHFTLRFGGVSTRCAGGGVCAASTVPSAIVTGEDGSLYIAGVTNATDFPVTQNAAHVVCTDCSTEASRAFLVRLNAAGQILYATYLPFAPGILSLAVDRQGAMYVAVSSVLINGNAHIEALNPAGAEVYRTTVPFNVLSISAEEGSVTGLKKTFSPYPPDAFRLSRSGELNGYGPLFSASDPPAVALGKSIVAIVNGEASSFFYRWTMVEAPAPAITHMASSTGQRAIAQVAPGELLSFYGSGLGPAPSQSSEFDSNGRLPVELAGVNVLVDGRPTAMLYASDTQVNAIVPWDVSGAVRVELCRLACAAAVDLLVVPSQPNWFTEPPPSSQIYLGRFAIAFNSDGARNSEQNPARPGSTLTLFASGTGEPRAALPDGAVGVPGQGTPSLPLELTITVDPLYRGALYLGPPNVAVDILYAGSLAQTANGVVQMNLRLPVMDLPAVHAARLVLKAGDASAPPAVIFVSNGGR